MSWSASLVMITGASSGIGKALAQAFAREGNPLLLISRHIEPIAGLPESTIYRQADVADYGGRGDGGGPQPPISVAGLDPAIFLTVTPDPSCPALSRASRSLGAGRWPGQARP